MGAKKTDLSPTSWAVKGVYEGLSYDGINAIPLPDKEKIVLTITTDAGDIKKIDEAPFPAKKQTPEGFLQITRQVVGQKLLVLL